MFIKFYDENGKLKGCDYYDDDGKYIGVIIGHVEDTNGECVGLHTRSKADYKPPVFDGYDAESEYQAYVDYIEWLRLCMDGVEMLQIKLSDTEKNPNL